MSGTYDLNGVIPPGTVLNGTYEVGRLLAVGGMGEVYEGRQIATGDAVAIKVIKPDIAGHEAALALFRKEASALHHLYHPAIIRYFAFAIDPSLNRPYLAMEYVSGPSLAEVVRGQALDAPSCLLLLERLTEALGVAHASGVIHRDISPDNIILPKGDVRLAKLIDFGIVKSTQVDAVTVIGGGFAGKYAYVSPEQLGLFGGEVTPRSDIYSLALVIAEAALGRPVDMGTTLAQTIDRRRSVPDLTGVHATLLPLLRDMLSPLPENRPSSMEDVRSRIGHGAGHANAVGGRNATGTGRQRLRDLEDLQRAGSTGRGPPWRLVSAALVLLALGIGTAAWFWRAPGEPAVVGEPIEDLPAGRSRFGQTAPSLIPLPDDDPAMADRGRAPEAPPAPAPPPVEQAQRPVPALQAPAVALPVADPPSDPARLNPPPVAGPVPPVTPAVPADRTNPPGLLSLQSTPTRPETPAQSFVRRANEATPCQFALLTREQEQTASIEAFGASIPAIQAFDLAFKREVGFEANIQFRPLNEAQCAAVDFLRTLAPTPDPAVRFQLRNQILRAGQTAEGTLMGVGTRSVTILLVLDDGQVMQVPVRGLPTAQGVGVTVPAEATTPGTRRPKLLIALLTSQRPSAAVFTGRVAGSSLFPALATDLQADRGVASVALQYFRID